MLTVILHTSWKKCNFQFLLDTKRIRNPVEYCTDQLTVGPPSDYAGHYFNLNISNEHKNIQDSGQNQNTGEGESSRIFNVAIDDEGREIDLNKSYYNDEDINEHQD